MKYVGQIPGQLVISLADSGPSPIELAAENISAAQRKEWQSQGYSMPDGSYPIQDIPALRRAIQSFGRAAPSKRPALVSHIKTRAEALKASNLDWVRNFLLSRGPGGSRDATKKAPTKTYGMRPAA